MHPGRSGRRTAYRSVSFAPHKLKAVEIGGGSARETADLIVGRGAAWSPEGVIVFCPRPIGHLYQVPAAGGTPSPVTSLDEARGEVARGFPQFLPDGRQFLYLATSFRSGESSIYAGTLDSTRPKVLLSADSGVAYLDCGAQGPRGRGEAASLFGIPRMSTAHDFRRRK